MGNKLKVARAERDVNQEQVAKAVCFHRDTYFRIEKGYRLATPEEQKAIARFLKKPVSDLFPEQSAVAS